MEKSILQAAIRAAFDDVPYPGDNNICPPSSRGDGNDITNWLRGKDWRSLPSKLPVPCLWWMTPEAAHYYLPAYLLGATETGLDSTLDDTILFLNPDRNANTASRHPSSLTILVSLLSTTQRQVIGDFFTYMLNNVLEFYTLRRERTLEYEANLDIETVDIDDRVRPTSEEIIEEYSEKMADAHSRFAGLINYWNSIGTK